MVAAPDGDRAGAVPARSICREIHRAQHEPRTGQLVAIPGHRRAVIRDETRLTFCVHRARFDVRQIGVQKRYPVRRVPKQVAFDEYRRYVCCAIRGHACRR